MKASNVFTVLKWVFIFVVAVFLVDWGQKAIHSYSEWASTYRCEYDDYNIYSVERNDNMHGSFAIAFGSIEERTYYYVYVEEGNGVILKKFNAEATIIEEQNRTPVYRSYDNYLFTNNCGERNTLIVPIGTVKVKYEVN